MTRPDLDAIRARWQKRGHSFDDKDEFQRHARADVPALLAYIDELEGRTTYTVGETEWAQRSASLEHMLSEERENVDTLRARVAELEAMKP
jgi:hypothetical protein